MKLILKEDIAKLGEKDDVVQVKSGFGRNFLIPQGKAVLATDSEMKILEEALKQKQIKEQKEIEKAQEISAKLNGKEFTVPVKAGSNGKIFGSVTSIQIAAILKENGFNLDRKLIEAEDIKELGNYTANIKLHKKVISEIKLKVIQD